MDAVTTLPHSRPFTRSDLDAVPDDGHRYELVDGALVVTPAPSPRHQTALVRLWSVLTAACPPELQVFVAPLDVVLCDETVLQPDVVVARRCDLSERNLPAAPVLAVEVLSPSTRRIDLFLKRAQYEAAGCRSYWVVDPDQPSLIAWDMHAEHYVEVGHATGAGEYVARLPYPVAVRPAALVEP